MDDLQIKLQQLSFASEKIDDLEKKLENFPFGLMDETSNGDKWKYYTGFTYEFVNQIIFFSIKEYMFSMSTTVLSPYNQLLLTLIKLRLNLHFKDLAYRFKIAPTTASTYFMNVLDVLYKRFKTLIIWPERAQSQKNIPLCFKEAFQSKTTVIIDCFEVFIERPSSLLTRQKCWSNYKHHHTIKFLIGITPQGTISYISQAWGGRASDKQIVEGSKFCDYIMPGDVVLADRGFLIKDTIGVLGAKLVIPAFTKGKSQLHPIEIEETRHIAQVRIHVERLIGMLKNKFNIFKDTIPISMLKKDNKENVNMLDKIAIVCSALVNLSPPIIPL